MEKERSESLKKSFTRMMQARILSGELKPGDRLLPERELAEEAGISRGSVNQGLLDLERMGFLRIVPRKGAFVTDFMSSANVETLAAIMSYDSALIDPELFRDLMAMRTLVECECVRLACERIGTAEISILNELTNRIYSVGREDIPAVLYDYHYRLIDFSGNKAYLLLFRSFSKMLHRLIELHYSNPGEAERALPAYHELSSAISIGDAAAAGRSISRILDTASDCLNKQLPAGLF